MLLSTLNIKLCYYLHMIICKNTVPNSTHGETVGTLQEPSCREALVLHFSVQMAGMFVWDFFIVVVAFHHLCWKCKSCYSKPIDIVRKMKFHLLLTDGSWGENQQKTPFARQHLLPVLSQKTLATVHEELWIAGDFTWWATRQMHILL